MAIESLLKHVPAAAMCRREPLPDEENALGPWREGIDRLIEPADDDAVWDRLHQDPASLEPVDENTVVEPFRPANLPFALPEGEDGRHIRRLFDANRPALERFEVGIERGRLQFPECHAPEDFSKLTDWVARIRQVVRLFRARAIAGVSDGDFDGAVRDLLRILRVGEMLCSGDGFVVHYLVGVAIRGIALEAMGKFAAVGRVPQRVRVELAAALRRSLAQPDAFAQCLRYDFGNFDLLCIDSYPDDGDLATLVDAWVEKTAGNTFWEQDLEEAQKRARLDARRAKCRRDFLLMLDGQPRPFDKIAAVRLAAQDVADVVRLLSLPPCRRKWSPFHLWIGWRRRRRQRWLDRQVAKWPEFYEMGVSWSESDDLPESVQNSMQESGRTTDLDLAEATKPPTDEQLLIARQELRRVDNPLGLLLASSMGIDMVGIHEQHQMRGIQAKIDLISQLESPAL